MKKKLALLALGLVSTSVLAACEAAPSAGSNAAGTEIGSDSLKLGLNFELSGAVAAYGKAEEKAANLAIEEINAAGGVDGKKIEAVTKDNKSDNAEAKAVATSLATKDKVVAMIGPASSGVTAAAIPAATEAAVPVLTPSGTDDKLTLTNGKANDYVFRATFQDSFQGKVMAQYATETLKAEKVVLYYDNSSDYAKGVAKNFKETYKGEIVVEETFQSGDKDFQAALTKLKDKEFDVIVMPGYYNEAGLITKQAREMGIDQTILGPDGFSDAKYIEGAGKENATNVRYVAGYSTKVELSSKSAAFQEAYKAKYDEAPNMFAALAYDSVYMIAEASKGAKTSKDIATNLAKLKDFEGVTGKMTIDENHNPVKTAVMVSLEDGVETTAEAVEVKE